MKRRLIAMTSALFLTLTSSQVLPYVPYEVLADEGSADSVIFNILTQEGGFNSAAACGILGNLQQECNLDPNAYSGSFYGLAQWDGGRTSNMRVFCEENGYDSSSVEGQTRFIVHELMYSYPGVYEALMNVEDSADGAYSAACTFCHDYEQCGNYDWEYGTRGSYAGGYWDSYGGTVNTEYGDYQSADDMDDRDAPTDDGDAPTDGTDAPAGSADDQTVDADAQAEGVDAPLDGADAQAGDGQEEFAAGRVEDKAVPEDGADAQAGDGQEEFAAGRVEDKAVPEDGADAPLDGADAQAGDGQEEFAAGRVEDKAVPEDGGEQESPEDSEDVSPESAGDEEEEEEKVSGVAEDEDQGGAAAAVFEYDPDGPYSEEVYRDLLTGGYDMSLIFDYDYYTTHYPEALEESASDDYNDVLYNFLTVGVTNGRRASLAFSCLNYQRNYEDLYEKYEDEYPYYYLHYLSEGYKLGYSAEVSEEQYAREQAEAQAEAEWEEYLASQQESGQYDDADRQEVIDAGYDN